MSENLQTEAVDSEAEVAYNEEWTAEDEQNLNGRTVGEEFVNRHIIEKINLFLEVYRREGYSEDFIRGFMDGVVDAAGGIHFPEGSEEAGEEVLESSSEV